MAIIASWTVVLIAIHPLVVLTNLLRVVVLVAVNATEIVVVPTDMALHAVVPLALVPTAVNREVHVVVVKS